MGCHTLYSTNCNSYTEAAVLRNLHHVVMFSVESYHFIHLHFITMVDQILLFSGMPSPTRFVRPHICPVYQDDFYWISPNEPSAPLLQFLASNASLLAASSCISLLWKWTALMKSWLMTSPPEVAALYVVSRLRLSTEVINLGQRTGWGLGGLNVELGKYGWSCKG